MYHLWTLFMYRQPSISISCFFLNHASDMSFIDVVDIVPPSLLWVLTMLIPCDIVHIWEATNTLYCGWTFVQNLKKGTNPPIPIIATFSNYKGKVLFSFLCASFDPKLYVVLWCYNEELWSVSKYKACHVGILTYRNRIECQTPFCCQYGKFYSCTQPWAHVASFFINKYLHPFTTFKFFQVGYICLALEDKCIKKKVILPNLASNVNKWSKCALITWHQ